MTTRHMGTEARQTVSKPRLGVNAPSRQRRTLREKRCRQPIRVPAIIPNQLYRSEEDEKEIEQM